MTKIRFKSSSRHKYKLLITIVISFLFSFIIISSFSHSVGEAIINTADALIKRENTLLFKNAFNKKESNIDADSLITVQKNANGEIVQVDFKIANCEKIMMSIIDEMNGDTNKLSTDGYILEIPIGYITNSPLLLNLGPKIPVRIVTTDVAVGSVETAIKEFGINSALIELYISIEIETNAILPLKSGTTKAVYKFLVASKIINGKVPDFYGGYISRESNKINLPII